ncbi:8930_t:CDS:2 [Entrophospora sp. SA101]|nr:8930_t:CDS:2 [Entrophospora sp. SA101]
MTKRETKTSLSFSEYYEHLISKNAEKLSQVNQIKRSSANEERSQNNYEKILVLSQAIVDQNSNLTNPNDIAFTFLTTSLSAELARIEEMLLVKTTARFSEKNKIEF